MQSLLKSLSPVERRVYWRWSLVVLAFYCVLLVVGGGAMLLHRSMITATSQASAGQATPGHVAEKIKPGVSVLVAR